MTLPRLALLLLVLILTYAGLALYVTAENLVHPRAPHGNAYSE